MNFQKFSTLRVNNSVIHLFQPDSLVLRGHLVMFQSTTPQGQAGLSQELNFAVVTSVNAPREEEGV